MKWMLLNFVTSFLGRPARNIEYDSTWFHFLLLFPLVSSEWNC
jgi:hypothetical protein